MPSFILIKSWNVKVCCSHACRYSNLLVHRIKTIKERVKNTSNCLNVSNNMMCLCWRAFNLFCSSETSDNIIDSHSLMTVSPTPSCTNRDLNFSVEMKTSSEGEKSLLVVNSLGKRSLADCRASSHAALSFLHMQCKWRVFVPVNMVSLLSSDLLARTEETCLPN